MNFCTFVKSIFIDDVDDVVMENNRLREDNERLKERNRECEELYDNCEQYIERERRNYAEHIKHIEKSYYFNQQQAFENERTLAILKSKDDTVREIARLHGEIDMLNRAIKERDETIKRLKNEKQCDFAEFKKFVNALPDAMMSSQSGFGNEQETYQGEQHSKYTEFINSQITQQM